MKKIYHNIVNMGLREGDDVVLRNKLKVFNVAITSILLISLFYLALALSHQYHLSTFVCAYSVLSCIIIFFLVHHRKHDFAFHFAMWYGFIFLASFSLIFGSVTNSHYYFLFLPISCLILFDNSRVITVYFILSVVIMLGSVIMMDVIEPFYTVENQEAYLGYPNIPFVMLLTFLAVRLFKNENRKYAVQIEDQKSVLEEKNKEITDSINYARRIQAALMAPAALLKKHLPEHYILYKPKDIVSGDFYFAAETQSGKFILCVGDCTGHGVPGAFMSLLNISILRELITEKKIESPDLLLNKQREQIIRSLNPDGAQEKAKDGMDCVVATFDPGNGKVEFACANNPVWIWRQGKLHEFKADKQPVGIHDGEVQPYTLHSWTTQPGDSIYFFTDGFADQFGGPRGKKFKYAQLKDTIAALHHVPVHQRADHLERVFADWKGSLDQVDDVLIIGIQL
jgi:phosphoserine phosphatase RsbU/P